MGGYLAQRFDIVLPEYLNRLDVIREEGQDLSELNLIQYKKPFWNDRLSDEEQDPLIAGNLFRHMYPLKTGAGCHGKCKYCTIRDTRGETYYMNPEDQEQEFLNHADQGVVIISDSPSIDQINKWCEIANRNHIEISFRNVEPTTAVACKEALLTLANQKLLKFFHCPIQSNQIEVLKAMNRDIEATMNYLTLADQLREKSVIIATNIIIDYRVNDTIYHNMDIKWLNDHFDYWSWNPYFDGNWNYDAAEQRYKKYIGEWISL